MSSPRSSKTPKQPRQPSQPVDPLSVLVSASELAHWRRNPTTAKVLDYLERWREMVVQELADGNSLVPEVGASAMKTTEYVAKAQLLDDILKIEAKDIADFYGIGEPGEGPAKPKTTKES